MQRQSHRGPSFKFVDLSSEGQSDNQSEKENLDSKSRSTVKTYTNNASHKPCTHDGVALPRQSSIINHARSTTPLKDLQFSTLSLEDASVDLQVQGRHLGAEHQNFAKENETLKTLNRELQSEIYNMVKKNTLLEQKICDFQQKDQWYEQQISELQTKIAAIQARHAKVIKEYENRLLNYELPGSKNLVQETRRVQAEIQERINGLTNKYVADLSKERMNVKVEQIITDLINSLKLVTSHDPAATNRSNDYSSNSSNKLMRPSNTGKAYRSQRINQLVGKETHSSSVISEDYRLLEKSIEKLKTMEREIESSSGSYLKRKAEEEPSLHNRSVGLDQSSICDLGRSKSRRKRIFQ